MASGNGTPGNCGPVCSVTAWAIDPQNTTTCASDNNSCTSATCGGGGIGPCSTMAQIVARYGTPTPKINFGLTLTVTWLSSQTINTDVFQFDPLVTGSGNFIEYGGATGTGTKVGSTFLVSTGGGSITAKVQTTSGAPLKLVFAGSTPPGIAVGQLAQNVTLGSWATVYKIAGLTVSVTQPLTAGPLTTPNPAPTFAEDNGWAAGNTYQLWQPVGVNVKNLQPQGGDANSSFTEGVAWYQGLHVFDSSASSGNSTTSIHSIGIPLGVTLSVFDTFLSASGIDNGNSLQFASCQGNGSYLSDALWFAGAMNLGAVDQTHIQNNTFVDGDAIIDATLSCDAGRTVMMSALINTGASVIIAGGSVKVATIELDQQTVFDTYLPSSGTWVNHAGPFTSANIDTGGGAGGAGVQNARTGSRYSPVN